MRQGNIQGGLRKGADIQILEKLSLSIRIRDRDPNFFGNAACGTGSAFNQ
jgi:hypothetical protein